MTDVPGPLTAVPSRLNLTGRVEDGELVLQVVPLPHTCRLGSVRASVLGLVVDVVAGVAVDRDVDLWTFTSAMSLRTLARPAPAWVEGRATVLRAGARSATSEVHLTDPVGDPFGYGVASFSRVARRPDDARKPAFDPAAGLRMWQTAPPVDVPLAEAVGIRVVDGTGGVVEVELTDVLRNPAGAMQGAIVAFVGEVAAEEMLSARRGAPALVTDLDVRYLAQARVGPVRTRGTWLGQGPDAWVLVELHDTSTGQLLSQVTARAGSAH